MTPAQLRIPSYAALVATALSQLGAVVGVDHLGIWVTSPRLGTVFVGQDLDEALVNVAELSARAEPSQVGVA